MGERGGGGGGEPHNTNQKFRNYDKCYDFIGRLLQPMHYLTPNVWVFRNVYCLRSDICPHKLEMAGSKEHHTMGIDSTMRSTDLIIFVRFLQQVP